MVRPVIHSTKHMVQYPFDAIPTATAQTIIIAFAKESTIADSADEIEEGTIIKAVFVELWLQNSANDGHQVVIIEKLAGAQTAATFAQMAALFSYPNKKNIFFTHEGLSSNDGVGNPMPIIRDWIKIPKSKQRFGLGDSLKITISNPSSNSLNRCGFALYKEYS